MGMGEETDGKTVFIIPIKSLSVRKTCSAKHRKQYGSLSVDILYQHISSSLHVPQENVFGLFSQNAVQNYILFLICRKF